jgi:hypothetical protein
MQANTTLSANIHKEEKKKKNCSMRNLKENKKHVSNLRPAFIE